MSFVRSDRTDDPEGHPFLREGPFLHASDPTLINAIAFQDVADHCARQHILTTRDVLAQVVFVTLHHTRNQPGATIQAYHRAAKEPTTRIEAPVPMATSQTTVDHLIDQLGELGDPSVKKMFGEFCVYLAGKPVGLICDDQLFLKPTKGGAAVLGGTPLEKSPYPGAKAHFLVPSDRWEDGQWLCQLIAATASEVPAKKSKKKTI